METGMPFASEEMLKMRTSQRQVVALIPPHWIRVSFPKRENSAADALQKLRNRPRLEFALRQSVAEDSDEVAAHLTDSLALFAIRETGSYLGRRLYNPEDGEMRELLEQLTKYDHAHPLTTRAQSDEGFQKLLARVVVRCILADELADDGYVDPWVAEFVDLQHSVIV